MTLTARTLLIAALAAALAACGKPARNERPPRPGDVVAARVDGRPIWTSDVRREAAAQGLIGKNAPFTPEAKEFRRVLDEVVDQRLMAAEAQRRGLDKTPAAQRRLAAVRDRALGDLLVEDMVDKAVTETAVRGLYQEQLKRAKPVTEYKARQIVAATAAEAEGVKKLLGAGAAFDALAMERSKDAATRFNGGDLGWFAVEAMPAPYGVALTGAKAGDLIGPFAAENGFVLLKVEDKRQAAPLTLAAARPQIVRFLTYDRVRDLLETLRAKAKIETQIPPARDPAAAPKPPASPATKKL